MERPPFEVRLELEGWALYWALLETSMAGAEAELARLRVAVAEGVRAENDLPRLSERPAVAALRKLFRAAGCDPTRYRPSSEALVRRLLKGADLPAIHPLVDLNNCLSASLAVPCCVMDETKVEPPFVLRAGAEGEAYESLKGPFRLAGKPLLVDARGPCDAPITGSQRVKVGPETRRAWLVAYLPAGVVEPAEAHASLERLMEVASVASVVASSP